MADHASAIERVAPGRVTAYLLNSGYTLSGAAEVIAATGRARWDLPAQGPSILHVMSPFELHLSIAELWPHRLRAAGTGLVVTVYDLIPLLFRDEYLASPFERARYVARTRFVSCADMVLTISENTRADVIARLGLPERRVRTIGTGVSDLFAPPTRPSDEIFGELRQRVHGIRRGHVLYTGGVDPRKNMEGLIRAYAVLDEPIRRAHQLVITCRMRPEDGDRLRTLARAHGIAEGDLLLTGFVEDEVLVRLYQTAALVVFPSLYEGFGLPAAEGLRCGAPVIASDTSSLPEIVRDRRARFNPYSSVEMAAALHRGLTDPSLRAALAEIAAGAATRFAWDDVARATVQAYDEVATHRRRSARTAARARRRRLAIVSPYPPDLTGVADYTRRLADALADHVDVDCFVERDPSGYVAPRSPRCRLLPARALELQRELARYDRVLYCMGNSGFHCFALELMKRVSGDVLAHDVCMAGLYAHASAENGASFPELVARVHGARRPPGAPPGHLPRTALEARRDGYFMLHELLEHSERLYVHSRYAAEILRLEGALLGRDVDVRLLPFAYPEPSEGGAGGGDRDDAVIVGTFGLVDPIKRPHALLRAFAHAAREHAGARLAFVGPIARGAERELVGVANRLGVTDRLIVTGSLPAASYQRWLARVDVAVQLRETSQGEASATVAEAQAHGAATVVTGLGWMADLPDDTVRKVPPTAQPRDIAAVLGELLADPQGRRSLGGAGRAHAARHAFGVLSEEIAARLMGDGS